MRRQTNVSKTGGRGGKRMKEFGYKAVTLWLDKKELDLVDKAAHSAASRRATWCRNQVVKLAREVLGL